MTQCRVRNYALISWDRPILELFVKGDLLLWAEKGGMVQTSSSALLGSDVWIDAGLPNCSMFASD